MNTLYEEMLVRLSNYRESRNLSQKEMGHLIGLTQSHYSKVERGIKVLSGMALISLSNFQVDVDFVLTGQRAKYTELNERMERCREQDREELARLIVWLVRQGAHLMEVRDGTDDMNYVKAAELFHMKEWNTKVSESIWYGIRRNNGYTQQQRQMYWISILRSIGKLRKRIGFQTLRCSLIYMRQQELYLQHCWRGNCII